MVKQNTLEKSPSVESFKAGTKRVVDICKDPKTELKPSRREADREQEFAVSDVGTKDCSDSHEFARGPRMTKISGIFTQGSRGRFESPREAEEANLRNLISESVSKNTLKTYRGALRRLGAFIGIEAEGEVNVGLLLEKLDDFTLARYVATLEAEGKAPATAQMVIAAVSYAVRFRNVKSPVNRLTAVAMQGFRRKGADRGRGQALGVTWTQAETMAVIAEKNPDSLSGIRDAALISVMSDAMLRISEAAALFVSDVMEETDGSGRLSVRRSKTDQEGRGTVLYLGRPTMVRVRAWREAGRVNDGALFRRVSRGKIYTSRVGEAALSPLSIRRILKARAAQVGIEGVSGHSMRVGAAQSMAASGATLVDMQIAGRWQSPQMPALYAKHQFAGSNAVARIRYACR